MKYTTANNKQLSPKPKNKSSHTFHQRNSNKMPHKKQQSSIVKDNICIICGKITDKCCSLCLKVFYCTAEHQEVHWHIKHKFQCQGRDIENTNVHQYHQQLKNNNEAQFTLYGKDQVYPQPQEDTIKKNNQEREQSYLYMKQEQQKQLRYFLELLEHRLLMRQKILGQVQKLNNERVSEIVKQSLTKQTEQLLELSTEITKKQYKPSYSKKSITASEDQQGRIIAYHTQFASSNSKMKIQQQNNQHSLAISEVGLFLEYINDHVLLVKVYHNSGMKKQAKQLLISIGRLLQIEEQQQLFLKTPDYNINSPTHMIQNIWSPQQRAQFFQQLFSSKCNLLKSIIQLGEIYCIDRTIQVMYKLFIKLVENYEGVWERIYAYFNIGVWYLTKTYYQKSIKAFIYVLELLNSHKKNTNQTINFKADAYYNLAISYWQFGQQIQAVQSMQQAYKCRVNGIGKNSIQASNCLQKLARWYKKQKQWQQCLQYLEECHRIRKQHLQTQEQVQSLHSLKILIAEVYQCIREGTSKVDNRNAESYYKNLLENQNKQYQEEKEVQASEAAMFPQERSVSKRLFKPNQNQYVQFVVNITPQMIETYSSKQVEQLSELFKLSDQKMLKKDAIKIIYESQFYESLNEKQREQFIDINKF